MKIKINPILIKGCIILICIISCKKEENVLKEEFPHSPLTFFTRSSDPRILQVALKDSNYIDFLGNKDQFGNMVSLNSVSVHQESFKEETTILLENGLIKSIRLADGTQLLITSANEDVYTYTLSTKDGSYRFNTGVKLEGFYEDRAILSSSLSVRNGERLRNITPSFDIIKPQIEINTAKALAGVKINVTKCGKIPANASSVSLSLYKNNSGIPDRIMPRIPAIHSGTGLYFAVVPTGVADDYIISASDICKFSINTVLEIEKSGKKASYKSLAKLLLASAMIISTNSPAISPDVSRNLKKIAEQLLLIEDSSDFLSTITDKLCNNFNLEDYKTNFAGVSMIAEAEVLGDAELKYSSLEKALNEAGPFPDLNISLGTLPVINNLIELNPNNPLVKQPYIATASLMCLPINTKVIISVSGSDGYKDSYSTTVSASNSKDPFIISLRVPGANKSGIKDIIIVNAITPSKTLEPKTTYLIFDSL